LSHKNKKAAIIDRCLIKIPNLNKNRERAAFSLTSNFPCLPELAAVRKRIAPGKEGLSEKPGHI
jgi:hypothetical protein